MQLIPLAIGMPGIEEWLVIAFIGLLLFGKRLPEVGRSLGKGIVEFKKGLKGIEDDIEVHSGGVPAVRPQQHPYPQQPYQQPPYQHVPTTDAPRIAQPAMGAAVGAAPMAAAPAQPYRFDPYTGKPIRFDPYTGKPISEEPVAAAQNPPTDNGVGA
jgi:sec-independent protein translocase protein TatA